MADIDIRQLTNDAEAGDGCTLVAALHQLPYRRTLETLQAVAKLNVDDVAANKSIPPLHFEDDWRNGSASLYRPDSGQRILWGKEIVRMNYLEAEVNGEKPKFRCSD